MYESNFHSKEECEIFKWEKSLSGNCYSWCVLLILYNNLSQFWLIWLYIDAKLVGKMKTDTPQCIKNKSTFTVRSWHTFTRITLTADGVIPLQSYLQSFISLFFSSRHCVHVQHGHWALSACVLSTTYLFFPLTLFLIFWYWFN